MVLCLQILHYRKASSSLLAELNFYALLVQLKPAEVTKPLGSIILFFSGKLFDGSEINHLSGRRCLTFLSLETEFISPISPPTARPLTTAHHYDH